jgi:hypothetical protein
MGRTVPFPLLDDLGGPQLPKGIWGKVAMTFYKQTAPCVMTLPLMAGSNFKLKNFPYWM